MAAERILFIEDDPHGLEVGLFNLKKAGYHVDGAANGAEGLDLFDPDRHGLVITDVKMPGLSGLEVLELLNKREPRPQVIMVTSVLDVEAIEESMKLGAFDYVAKPFNMADLVGRIYRAIEKKRATDTLESTRSTQDFQYSESLSASFQSRALL